MLVQALESVEKGAGQRRQKRDVRAVTRRARVDAELVRRGLARSRQQAAELIGAGRVRIDGLPAVKPATAVAVTAALTVGRRRRTHAGCRGARTSSSVRWTPSGSPSTAAAAWTPARRPVGSPKCCWIAAPEVVAVDVGYGQLAWSLRSRSAGARRRAHQRRDADARGHRRAGRPGGRRPVVHLADHRVAGAGCVRVARRGYRSHGEAAVRGREGPGGRRRGGSRSRVARRCRCCASRGAPRSWTGTPSASRPARCRARRATSNTSCGCAPRPIGGCLPMG